MNTFKTYYHLTKPGIIRGNMLAATAGFFLASPARSFSLQLFVFMLVGLALVIGSGCVFNNIIDRRIDATMARTKKRALVTGKVSVPAALIYATALGLAGFSILALGTNILAAALAALGFIFYVVIYELAKRRAPWGTEVGSISGAVPPIVGYCAASGRFDIGALLLFLVLAFWQMPHFFAIAIYRLSDYQAAKIPVLPAVKGMAVTARRMTVYVCIFVAAVIALAIFGPGSWLFGLVIVLVSLMWLRKVFATPRTENYEAWAKSVFGTSLRVLLTICVMSVVDFAVRSFFQSM